MDSCTERREARVHKSQGVLQAIKAEAISLTLEAKRVFGQFTGGDQLMLEHDRVVKKPFGDILDRQGAFL